jgi:hypothetical protein
MSDQFDQITWRKYLTVVRITWAFGKKESPLVLHDAAKLFPAVGQSRVRAERIKVSGAPKLASKAIADCIKESVVIVPRQYQLKSNQH